MKAIITTEDVAATIQQLRAAGKNPSIAAIHAALGNKGSLTTVMKLKRDVEQGTSPAVPDDSEALAHFRQLWQAAVSIGRQQRDVELAEQNDTVDALATENTRLEAACIGMGERISELSQQRDQLIADLAQAQRDVATAQAAGQTHAASAAEALGRLADWQRGAEIAAAEIRERHAADLATAHKRGVDAEHEAHQVKIQLATAKAQLGSAKEEAEQLRNDLRTARDNASRAEDRTQALSLALAEVAKHRGQDGRSPTQHAKAAAAKPSPRASNSERAPKAKTPPSVAPASKARGSSSGS